MTLKRIESRCTWGAVVLALSLRSAPIELDSCDTPDAWQIKQKPAGVEATTGRDGNGHAIRVTLPGQVQRTLARNYVPGSAAWDDYEGVSFWVKGDGSEQFGCLALVGRYAFVHYFSLADTEWRQLTVPWADFVPESQVYPLGSFGSMPPSGIKALRLGSRWRITHNNARIPEYAFSIDQIQLVKDVPAPPDPPALRPLAEVLEQLKNGAPVRIQCMGDSITAGTGLRRADEERYAVQIQDLLRQWLSNDGIVGYSRAVGGARSTDCRAWVPRDFQGQPPDLVTLWIGYNDKSGGYTCQYFKDSVNDYIDRVAQATQGQSAMLLLATGPGCGPRFVMLDDYAQAIRQIGAERRIAVVDMHAALKAIGRQEIEAYFGDMAHPNAKGHAFIADTVCEFLVKQAGIATPKPEPPPKPQAPPGQVHTWDFETGPDNWRFDSPDIALTDDQAASGKTSIRFLLTEPGTDHRRAFSPPMKVQPYQRYRVKADFKTEQLESGRYGLYVLVYDNAACEGNFEVIPVKGGPAPMGLWAVHDGVVEIPQGAQGMRVMIWSLRESVCTFLADDVQVTPVTD